MTSKRKDLGSVRVDSLEHYGIKGMKWGVRRSQEQLDRAAGRRTSSSKSGGKANLKSRSKKASLRSSSPSQDHQKAASLRSNKTTSLSNADLKVINERLNLEANYRRLQQGEQHPAAKFTQNVLTEVGKELTKNAVRQGTKSAGQYLSDRLRNRK